MNFNQAVTAASERWGLDYLETVEQERGHWVAYLRDESEQDSGLCHDCHEDEHGPNLRGFFVETGEPYDPAQPLRCPGCKQMCDADAPDPCLGWVPGVEYACCGHGEKLGYFKLCDGATIYGVSSVKDLADWAAGVAIRYSDVIE